VVILYHYKSTGCVLLYTVRIVCCVILLIDSTGLGLVIAEINGLVSVTCLAVHIHDFVFNIVFVLNGDLIY